MEKGKIIFLNGVSSAGKTTLAKALQERFDEPYYIINVDMFLGTGIMFPEKFATNDLAEFEMFVRTLSGMHHSIKLYSDLGMNTIVDHVLVNRFFDLGNPKLMEECVELLHEHPVLFVHVTCSVEKLRRREKKRSDRHSGQAEGQLVQLVPKDTYDLIVDTYNSTLDECVDEIITTLGCPDRFMAFKVLWAQQTAKPSAVMENATT
ncbi:MAG: AAA family ATPase [Oscillospiraceae bacterium]|nr:AAA family ATPase [Oscillospiraceae bacterium]